MSATSDASRAAADRQLSPRSGRPIHSSALRTRTAARARGRRGRVRDKGPHHAARRRRRRALGREASGFATVGAFAVAVDVGSYNALVHLSSDGWLAEQPLVAKTVSVTASTTVAYIGNRFWTYRDRPRGRIAHEYALFFVLSAVGLSIALGCLAFSRYALGLTSALADNVAANVVGLALGSLFRFLSYRRYVFRHPPPT